MDKYLGKVFSNSLGLEYRVTSVNHSTPKKKYYNIIFLESGYQTQTTSSEINAKKVKDKLAPTVFGVGCMGYVQRANSNFKREYSVWHDMLSRCYNPNYYQKQYDREAGVTVCERWLRFEFFLEDIVMLPGWDKALFDAKLIYLDKDRLSGHQKIYSPETCIWLSAKENHPANNNEYIYGRCNDYSSGGEIPQ